jgi:sugar lactone lactonase YvrE
MNTHRLAAAALLALAFALPSSMAQPADAATVQALKAQLARIETLRGERPGDGLLVYYQALTHAQLGEREASLAALRALVGRRLGLLPTRGSGFDALWDDAEFQAVRAQLAAAEPSTPRAPVQLSLRGTPLVPEGIAYDAKRKRFYIGSPERRIVTVERRAGTAQPREFSKPTDRLDAVLGLTVARDHLYAVSTNGFLESAAQGRRNAVLRYDLARGRLAARHDAPQAQQLNDVAVHDDGTLYATDSLGGTLFRLRPGESTLTPFGAEGALRGANGLALSTDGKALYVAISTGIARVELAGGATMRLPQPDDVVTGGIDGLYWHDGALLGVQNAINPGRVVRIALTDGGMRIGSMTVLQSHHHPAFDEPTTGTLVDRRTLVVLANAQLNRLGPDGTVAEPRTLKPLVLLAIPLAG